MKFRTLRSLGISLIVGVGAVHLIVVPEAITRHPSGQYINVLFILNFFGAILSVLGMRNKSTGWGWLLGLVISGGSIAGYVLSRTVGLPGAGIEEWFVPIGLLSLLFEGLFVLVTFLAWMHLDSAQVFPQKFSFSFSVPKTAIARTGTYIEMDAPSSKMPVNFFPPMVTILTVFCVSLGIFVRLSKTEKISQDDLEEKYGVRVTMVATTMMGDLVDIRLKIIDADKAQQMYYDHWIMPSLLLPVNDNLRILPPRIHSHSLIEGRSYSIFYPNVQHLVQPGTAVSVLFGNLELEPVTTR